MLNNNDISLFIRKVGNHLQIYEFHSLVRVLHSLRRLLYTLVAMPIASACDSFWVTLKNYGRRRLTKPLLIKPIAFLKSSQVCSNLYLYHIQASGRILVNETIRLVKPEEPGL